MNFKAGILDEKSMKRTLTRISHEIIEKNKGVENVILVGIKRRGYPLAQRIGEIIEKIEGVKVQVSSIDISLYRDDLELISNSPIIKNEDIQIDIKDKNIVLVDDVIYTGRTVRAALDAVMDNGRPKNIQLAVLVDRGHRELPIRADYVGKNIPTANEELVFVKVSEFDGEDSVAIYDL